MRMSVIHSLIQGNVKCVCQGLNIVWKLFLIDVLCGPMVAPKLGGIDCISHAVVGDFCG